MCHSGWKYYRLFRQEQFDLFVYLFIIVSIFLWICQLNVSAMTWTSEYKYAHLFAALRSVCIKQKDEIMSASIKNKENKLLYVFKAIIIVSTSLQILFSYEHFCSSCEVCLVILHFESSVRML